MSYRALQGLGFRVSGSMGMEVPRLRIYSNQDQLSIIKAGILRGLAGGEPLRLTCHGNARFEKDTTSGGLKPSSVNPCFRDSLASTSWAS